MFQGWLHWWRVQLLLDRARNIVTACRNALTAGVIGIQRMVIPCVMPSDLAAVSAAIACRGRSAPLRLAWITDTLRTELLGVSPALLEEAGGREDLEVVRGLAPMPFDAQGALRALAAG